MGREGKESERKGGAEMLRLRAARGGDWPNGTAAYCCNSPDSLFRPPTLWRPGVPPRRSRAHAVIPAVHISRRFLLSQTYHLRR
jgi:hypothetical protein